MRFPRRASLRNSVFVGVNMPGFNRRFTRIQTDVVEQKRTAKPRRLVPLVFFCEPIRIGVYLCPSVLRLFLPVNLRRIDQAFLGHHRGAILDTAKETGLVAFVAGRTHLLNLGQ